MHYASTSNASPAAFINGTTQVYLCIAHPSAHVKAPEVFNELFAQRGLNVVTVAVDVAPEDLASFVEGARGWRNLIGFGLTIPHKEAVVPLLDELDETARVVGAVNTVRREQDGSLVGGIFDGSGFVAGIEKAGIALSGMRTLLVGAGGAGRAIAFGLASAGVATIGICNRSGERAHRLASDLTAAHPRLDVDATAEPGPDWDLIVNATSLGMRPEDPLPIDIAVLDPGAIVAEAVMTPEVTRLIADSRARGLRTHPGRPMRDSQIEAVLQFLGL